MTWDQTLCSSMIRCQASCRKTRVRLASTAGVESPVLTAGLQSDCWIWYKHLF